MKKKFLTLTVLTLLLMVSCQSESDDGMDSKSTFANEIPSHDIERFMEIIGNTKSNDNALNKSGNNGNGVHIVPFYSDDGRWWAFFPITDTRYMVLDFPQNGEDRALVFSETEMMVNFTSHDPRLYIIDFATGEILHDNWCDPDRSGLYKARIITTYIPVDRDGDGVIDFYWWGPNAPGTVMDKNGIFHVKATLTAGPCNVDGEPVAFSYTIQAKNGRQVITTTMR
jgi:hypothetical protein